MSHDLIQFVNSGRVYCSRTGLILTLFDKRLYTRKIVIILEMRGKKENGFTVLFIQFFACRL